ncbi:S-layer homology domain-containing protein [Propionispira raffinosivorans]|uniref:S-layer homology domain-containing protein n=1 Tax=Propionispira raffinosivorans TaxID=86959 RepID=UPI000367F83D|nr:S-layer homology domain-containing protein [Propionispira raffinosivorans]
MRNKKKVILSVLSTLIISTSVASAAAANQLYSDVAQDNWAVAAVTKLTNDGIVTGYGDGTFRGDRAITRYEMAQMIASARTHSEKASEADKALIQRLSNEFSDELNSLGIRMQNVEKKTDNVKVSGIFANKAMKGITGGNTWWEKELFLNVDGDVGDGWKLHGGLDWKWGTNTKGWNGEESFSDLYGTSNKEVNAMIYQLYAQGPVGKGLTTTVGLFTPSLQEGVVGNARTKGVELDYNIGKNTLRAYTGKVYEKNGDLSSPWSDGFIRNGNRYDFYNDGSTRDDMTLRVNGFSAEHAFTPKTAAGIGYYRLKSPNAYDSRLGIVALNARQKLDDNLDLVGFYSHGNQGHQDNAYDIKFVYNGSPWGSNKWGSSIGYRYLGADALILSSVVNGSEKPGSKGMEASVWYHFTKNIQMQNYFFFGKAIDADYAGSHPNHTAFFSNFIFAF